MGYATVREGVIVRDGRIELTGLPFRAGERVKIFVLTDRSIDKKGDSHPLHGQPIDFPEPFAPAADPDEWEANR